jgi:hypothetical protein
MASRDGTGRVKLEAAQVTNHIQQMIGRTRATIEVLAGGVIVRVFIEKHLNANEQKRKNCCCRRGTAAAIAS